MKKIGLIVCMCLSALMLWAGGSSESAETEVSTENLLTVTDSFGREVTVPDNPSRIICSGPGALRLAVYLQAEDRVIAVDDIEKRRSTFDARPYAIAHPELKELPLFGEFRGHDNPELILGLEPQPQVIFKTYPKMGYDAEELQKKTGIPVVTLEYGDLSGNRDALFSSLRLMGDVLNKEERAEDVIEFMSAAISDLEQRTAGIPMDDKISCYVGGIAFKGPHGIQSTEPAYPPFIFINARNVAFDSEKPLREQLHADVAKEKILEWDPDILFIDTSTLQSGDKSGALYQLMNDGIFENMKAVKSGEVYGLLPYNWYTRNFGSVLANAYYAGTILYPDNFGDINPEEKADEIYSFLDGDPVLTQMNESFSGMAFSRIPVKNAN